MTLSFTEHRMISYKSGSMISQSGEDVNSLMIITEGIIKGEMVDYDGRVIKIEDIRAPGALAPAFMFGRNNYYPVNVIAVTDSKVFCVDKKNLLKILMHDRSILVNFLNMVSNRAQFLSEKIKFLNFKTLKAKLAHYILQKAGKKGNTVRLDLTQNELAEFFGVARPSVARILGDLEREGFIIAAGKNIKIINKLGLAELTLD